MKPPPVSTENAKPSDAHFVGIRKRDGRVVPFDAEKISVAILKAGRATGEFATEPAARTLMSQVVALAETVLKRDAPTVEGIQDLVEDVLITSPFRRTAKAYISYRDQHARNREILDKADVDLVDRYFDQLDWQAQECSNSSFSLQGLNNYISSKISQGYWLNKIYTREIRDAHLSGDFHIHDLGLLSVYCQGWDLRDLLLSGFHGAMGKVESWPARHFRTALGQIVNFFFTLQGESAGAQAFSNFDTLLAPFIRVDRLGYAEVKQALQEFIFNLNVPTRVGFQAPFTNLTLDLQPPAILANEPVIIGGQLQHETHAEFAAEMALLNRAFLAVLTEGDAKGRVFTFPIPTYSITRGSDWDNPALKDLWTVTAKYGIPYFANFVNSEMSPDDARSMCCHLRLDLRTLQRRGGGLFGANPLTGSVGVVTINMPRIGFLASTEQEFLQRLDKLMDIARDSLETKRKVLERYTEKDLYPYTKFYLRHVRERFGSYWNNDFATIGLVGMNEACLNLLGRDIGTPEGREFAAWVLDHMRDRLQQYQEETGNFYNLEATPAESTSYRLAKIDQQRHPGILCANHRDVEVGAKPFYTNSSQLPVNYTDDIFHALDLQDQLQAKYTGGTVLHVFLGEAAADPQAVKRFVRNVCESYRLPYLTISPTFSVCPSHGYLRGEHAKCPECGTPAEVYSRVVGYMRPVSQWNEGKQAEFGLRTPYNIGDTP
jgi:ribonucleoside-triphosphate reductase (formate)